MSYNYITANQSMNNYNNFKNNSTSSYDNNQLMNNYTNFKNNSSSSYDNNNYNYNSNNYNNYNDTINETLENNNQNANDPIAPLPKNIQPKSILKKSETINNIKPFMKNSSKDLLGYNINTKNSEKPKRHATINEKPTRSRKYSLSSGTSGTNVLPPNKLQMGMNKPAAPKSIFRNNTLRESTLQYTGHREVPFKRDRDIEFKLIKSNSADNLCNRSIQNNKQVLLKSKLGSQDRMKNDETFINGINGIEKENDKDFDNGEQVKILKTSDITTSKENYIFIYIFYIY